MSTPHHTFELEGEQLHLYPDRSAFWPGQSALLLADLHIGKTITGKRGYVNDLGELLWFNPIIVDDHNNAAYFKAVIERLNALEGTTDADGRSLEPDLIAITGDVTDAGFDE